MWGFYFFSPFSTICICIFACTQCIHLIRCFQCMWSMFFNKSFYLGFFLMQVFPLLCLSYLFVFIFFWPFLALVFWPLFLLLPFNFSGTFSVIFGLIIFHYFGSINIFIIWYFLSSCFDFCIELCIICVS